MHFALAPAIEALHGRIRRFGDNRLIPLERDRAHLDPHPNIRPDLLAELGPRAFGRCHRHARAAGWAMHGRKGFITGARRRSPPF